MDVNQEEIHNILVALLSGHEKEIYKVLYKKKEIDDKTPKLRTEDENNMLKSLSNKMRKFPKDLIDGIQKKFPFLQRTPKTAEQRQEQVKECNRQKRSAESETDKEMRLKKQKKYNEKRSAQSDIDKKMRLKKQKQYDHEKRSTESEKDKDMRVNKQKEYEHKRYTKSTEIRAKKVQEVREKRSAQSEIEKESRLTQDKEYHRKKRRQPSKDWKQELIDKASLTHICTSECRYRPKDSMVVVRDKMFTSEQMRLLTINNETLSIDGKHYVCKYCKNSIKKNKIPPCNEKIKKFMIDKLPE